jgi:prepilin-type N-terminal cleavage/methylation domain-containing protein
MICLLANYPERRGIMSEEAELQNSGRRVERGFTLIEVMVACAIASILCASVITVELQMDNSNRYLFNRTTGSRAAHQMMEILLSDDMDSMLLQNGNTFAVTGMIGGAMTGTITMTDLGWTGQSDMAWKVKLVVPLPGNQNETFVLEAVRTRA